MTFNKSKFLATIFILDTRYKYFGSLNNNLFYFVNSQTNYILVYCFTNLEINKHNINKLFIHFLIKLIIKILLYYNKKE